MAQQTIGIGSSPNDGTGDDLRTGGGKINANFTELYDRTKAFASDASASTGVVNVDADDNVGIGTGAPSARLDVINLNGKAQAVRVRVTDMGDVASEHGLLLDIDIADFSPGQNTTHYGVRVNMDSAATTPTDSSGDQHLVQGMRSDVNVAGSARIGYGVNASCDVSGGDVTQNGIATAVFAQAGTSHSDAGGAGPTLTAVDGRSVAAHTAGTIVAYGVRGVMQQTGAGGTVSLGAAVAAEVDHDAGTLSVGYQFRGTTAGSPGTSYGIYSDGAGLHYLEAGHASANGLTINQANASFAGDVLAVETDRAAATSYDLITAKSDADGSPDVEFRVRGDGQVTADGSFTGGGADYAELFEWTDGNPDGADRVGLSVVLEGAKIRPATQDDSPWDVVGAISATPVVIGDAHELAWRGKFQTDPFGRRSFESYTVLRWTEAVAEKVDRQVTKPDGTEAIEQVVRTRRVVRAYPADRIPDGVTPPANAERLTTDAAGQPFLRERVSPDFDPSRDYVPPLQRPEYDPVGLAGKLRIRKGQPVGAAWRKMADIDENVELWLVMPAPRRDALAALIQSVVVGGGR